jgi:hypothetical protein
MMPAWALVLATALAGICLLPARATAQVTGQFSPVPQASLVSSTGVLLANQTLQQVSI